MQQFAGMSDWNAIADVRGAVDKVPVIANGEIVSVESPGGFSTFGLSRYHARPQGDQGTMDHS